MMAEHCILFLIYPVVLEDMTSINPNGKMKLGANQKNLGKSVNSSLDEMTPFIHDNTLFFASKGHVGLGGFDLF